LETLPSTVITDLDFNLENTIVDVIAAKNIQDLDLVGVKIGTHSAGDEFQVRRWVAEQLKDAETVRLKEEEIIDLRSLQKIQWIETNLQTGRRVSELPKMFYPKLRRYINQLQEEEMHSELNQALRLANDVVNSRLNRVINLSSTSPVTNAIIRNLTDEEKGLCESLSKIIFDWREKILQSEVLD
jgi:DNA replication initiation complex subunit (GINS family)